MGGWAVSLGAGSLWVLVAVVVAQIQGCGGGAPTRPAKWTYATGGDVRSSPAVADGVVFVGSNDAKLHAVDAATGEAKWTYATGGGVTSSPAVADGKVFVGSFDQKLHAVDAATGKAKWTYSTGGGVYSIPAVAYEVVFVTSHRGWGKDPNVQDAHTKLGSAVYS